MIIINSSLNAIRDFKIGIEQQIGTLDGKPIYQKIYKATGISASSELIVDSSFTFEKIDFILEFSGSYVRDNVLYPIVHAHQGSTAFTQTLVGNTGLRIVIQNGAIIQGYFLKIIYTKA